VRSKAATPAAYLAELDPDRAAELRPVYDAIKQALPDGYDERMASGMITWEVPIILSGPTYNGQPLMFAALAAQKRHNALHLMCVYACDERRAQLRQGFADAGKKLDMGKSCIRFKRSGDLALNVIAQMIGSIPPDRYVASVNAAPVR